LPQTFLYRGFLKRLGSTLHPSTLLKGIVARSCCPPIIISRELRWCCGGVAVVLRWCCGGRGAGGVAVVLRWGVQVCCGGVAVGVAKHRPLRGRRPSLNCVAGKGTPRVVSRGKKRGACRIYWRNKQKTPPKLISRHLLHHCGVNSGGNPPIILRAIYYTTTVSITGGRRGAFSTPPFYPF